MVKFTNEIAKRCARWILLETSPAPLPMLHPVRDDMAAAADEIDRLQKLIPNEPQTSWQPIETAPKDGTEVLVWCDEGLDIARYSDRVEDAPDDMGHDAGWWGIRQPMDPGRSMGNPDYMRPAENQPWAWMPKPEAPYDDEGEPLFRSSPKLPFHDETMAGLSSLTIRNQSKSK